MAYRKTNLSRAPEVKGNSSYYDVGGYPQYYPVLSNSTGCPRYQRQTMNGEVSDGKMQKKNECDPLEIRGLNWSCRRRRKAVG